MPTPEPRGQSGQVSDLAAPRALQWGQGSWAGSAVEGLPHTPMGLPPTWFYPALKGSEPQSRGSGIWGFFCLKERSGPSKGSPLPLPPFPTPPPRTAGLGPPVGLGAWQSPCARRAAGLVRIVFPPLASALPRCPPPPNTWFQSPLRPLSPSPAPSHFLSEALTCMWNSLEAPQAW